MPIDVDRLYREYGDKLVRALGARHSHVDRDTIEEACAEAWLIAWRHRDNVRPEQPFGWLYVVARNALLFLLARRKGELLDDVAAFELRSARADPELALEVREALAALAALKPNQRRALTLRLAGLSYVEIQKVENVSFTWVNRHLTEGRRAMRAAVEIEP
jgi:RNA polymerase sigma factor (sigma-70 family)